MDFGFIQTAVPASQPVPLTNAAAPADAFTETAAAFDAALAQTLGSVEAGVADTATLPSSGSPRAALPAWMASLFAATMTASAASPEVAIETGEAAVAADAAPVDAAVVADGGEADDTAVAAEIAVTTPPVVVTTPPVVVMPPTVVEMPTPAAQPKSQMALADARPADSKAAVTTDVVPQAPALPADQTASVPVDRAPAGRTDRSTAPKAAQAAPAEPLMVTDPAAAAGSRVVTLNPAASSAEPIKAPDVEANISTGSATVSAAPVPARSSAVRTPQFANVAMSSQTTPQPAAAVVNRPDVQAAIADAAPAIVPALNSGEATRSQTAESAATLVTNFSSQSAAGQDAPMTGQEQQNGQGRPSPEFARFAAALAQVSPAPAEHTAPAPVPVVSTTQAAAPAASVAAPAATAVATAAPEDVPGPENVGRLVQAMRVIARPGAWEANVRLNPEHLGDVSIAVRVERNTVSAVVNAEAAGVRQWLESQEQAVRNGMAEHGLQLDRFIVQRDGQRREAEPQQQHEAPRQRARRSAAMTTERFEIVV
jgi:flagellar hook-length control protein FliK